MQDQIYRRRKRRLLRHPEGRLDRESTLARHSTILSSLIEALPKKWVVVFATQWNIIKIPPLLEACMHDSSLGRKLNLYPSGSYIHVTKISTVPQLSTSLQSEVPRIRVLDLATYSAGTDRVICHCAGHDSYLSSLSHLTLQPLLVLT